MSLTRRDAVVGVGALGLSACGASDDAGQGGGTRLLYSADILPTDFPTVEAVRAMGALLRERSDGRLGVKVYSGGQLGSERDTLEIALFGGLDMNRVAAAPLNSLVPMTVVPCLPFVFRDIAHMRRALDGPPGREILASFEPYGLIGLCFYDSGARSVYNTKKPIRTPDDMAGMKLRVQNSDLYVSMIEALGADATPMYLGEVYQSLVQGVIDGAENNWPSYESGRHFEVAGYYSLTRHVMAPEVLVMSRHRWSSLSEDDQHLVLECARDSVPFMRELWDARVEASRQLVLASGIQANEVDDITEFSSLMRPLWDRFAASEQQRRVIDDIQAMADVPDPSGDGSGAGSGEGR